MRIGGREEEGRERDGRAGVETGEGGERMKKLGGGQGGREGCHLSSPFADDVGKLTGNADMEKLITWETDH